VSVTGFVIVLFFGLDFFHFQVVRVDLRIFIFWLLFFLFNFDFDFLDGLVSLKPKANIDKFL
jgi:hypothetical protein